MPKFWRVPLPGEQSNPGSRQDIYLFSRFPLRILVKSRITRIPFQSLVVVGISKFPSISSSTEGTKDVVMKSEDGIQKNLGKKALKRINKKKNLKRLTNKKRKNQKILKW